jgi:hypothetical protein
MVLVHCGILWLLKYDPANEIRQIKRALARTTASTDTEENSFM